MQKEKTPDRVDSNLPIFGGARDKKREKKVRGAHRKPNNAHKAEEGKSGSEKKGSINSHASIKSPFKKIESGEP